MKIMKDLNFTIYLLFTLVLLFGCIDVDENVFDKYAAEEFYSTPQGADAALASVYAQIPGNWDGVGYAGADRGWYDINSMTTDEQVIPHRNDGNWELSFAQLYLRDWLPSDGFFNNAWRWLYRSVYLANLAVDQLESAGADPSKIAEAKVLRAFFYYLLIDGFGNVPFYTQNNLTESQIPQADRKEVFEFVVKELTENVETLSPVKGGDYYGRFNKWAGYALLAKVYLNAEVYSGQEMWDECLAAIAKIEEGGFSLHPATADPNHPLGNTYFELFGDVLPGDETILSIPTTVDLVGRVIFTTRSLGGADGSVLLGTAAWNGAIVPQDFVEKFNDNDIRKRQFRFGENPYGPKPAGFIGYDLEVNNLTDPGADPNAGARNQKFWPAEPRNDGGASNDFPIYRYADFLLMKAECLVRLNNAAEAKPSIDQVRVRAGLNPLAGNPTLEDIYNERGFELSWENHRRQDMIRFGAFTKARHIVPAVSDKYLLFPIPTAALNANPNLVQNEGWLN